MRSVEVHKQRAPMVGNEDCPWSVGILNLTEDEAAAIAQYARGIRSVNSPRARGLSAFDMSARGRLVNAPIDLTPEQMRALGVLQRDGRMEEAASFIAVCRDLNMVRRKDAWLGGGDWGEENDVKNAQTKPLTSVEEPGNRFSGLDLGPATTTTTSE